MTCPVDGSAVSVGIDRITEVDLAGLVVVPTLRLALAVPSRHGEIELAVKQAWWKQVFSDETQAVSQAEDDQLVRMANVRNRNQSLR